jgi:hypothetical protein
MIIRANVPETGTDAGKLLRKTIGDDGIPSLRRIYDLETRLAHLLVRDSVKYTRTAQKGFQLPGQPLHLSPGSFHPEADEIGCR